jgi:two-component system LytT family sensor kinase
MNAQVHKIFTALRSRVARNVYLWVLIIWDVLTINSGNERAFHYGVIQSPWYPWVMTAGVVCSAVLLYVNNLFLVPRFLARKRYAAYFLQVVPLILLVTLAYVLFLKKANEDINIDHLQHVGLVSSPVSNIWTAGEIIGDMNMYLSGYGLWVFIFTMAWYMNDYSRQKRLFLASEKKRVETELNFLKSQINPHFLFNTLNNVYGLALKKADNAPDVILKLSSILRYLLYDSNVSTVSFDKEKEVMQAYIDVELLRLPENKNFNFYIVSDGSYNIPPLLWLPVLENIFKHGTRYITDNYFIDYRFILEQQKLTVYGRNNYKAIVNGNGNGNGKAGGIGLENLRKRLELLYPQKHKVETVKDETAYTIQVQIDLA